MQSKGNTDALTTMTDTPNLRDPDYQDVTPAFPQGWGAPSTYQLPKPPPLPPGMQRPSEMPPRSQLITAKLREHGTVVLGRSFFAALRRDYNIGRADAEHNLFRLMTSGVVVVWFDSFTRSWMAGLPE